MCCLLFFFNFLFWNNFKLTDKMARTVQGILMYYSPRNVSFTDCLSGWKRVKMKELVPQSGPTLCKPTRLLCPGNSLSKNAGVGGHSLLQEIFLTQGSNPGLPHCRQLLYHLTYQGNPSVSIMSFKAKGSNPGSHAVVCVYVLLCLFSFLWPRIFPHLFCRISFNWVCLVFLFS